MAAKPSSDPPPGYNALPSSPPTSTSTDMDAAAAAQITTLNTEIQQITTLNAEIQQLNAELQRRAILSARIEQLRQDTRHLEQCFVPGEFCKTTLTVVSALVIVFGAFFLGRGTKEC